MLSFRSLLIALVTAAIAGALAAVNPPVYNTSRSIIVVSGANPTDNEVLNRALEALVSSKGLAAEVKRATELIASCKARLRKAEADVNKILE